MHHCFCGTFDKKLIFFPFHYRARSFICIMKEKKLGKIAFRLYCNLKMVNDLNKLFAIFDFLLSITANL